MHVHVIMHHVHTHAAMQMWTLGRFLPLVIGRLEDDEHWDNFLCLLDIMDILFARPVTPDACALAEVMINDHHSKFKGLYPNTSITLKMHSMIHMPRLMLESVRSCYCTCTCTCSSAFSDRVPCTCTHTEPCLRKHCCM